MTYPTAAVVTTNLDAGTDSPATARSDILDAVQKLNEMIAHTTAFAATLLGDASATTARATLGSTTVGDAVFIAADAAAARTALGAPSGTGSANGTNTGDQTSVSGSSGSCTGNAATATTDSQHLGVSQTWQDLTGSRSIGTIYTNSTGKPIQVAISGNTTSGTVTRFYINSALAGHDSGNNGVLNQWSYIIPNGATYEVDYTTGGTYVMSTWMELR